MDAVAGGAGKATLYRRGSWRVWCRRCHTIAHWRPPPAAGSWSPGIPAGTSRRSPRIGPGPVFQQLGLTGGRVDETYITRLTDEVILPPTPAPPVAPEPPHPA